MNPAGRVKPERRSEVVSEECNGHEGVGHGGYSREHGTERECSLIL